MSDEIELLMTLDPLDLSAQDIDKIIAYQRRMRAVAESGQKATKPATDSLKGIKLLESLKIVKPISVDRRD